MKSLGWVLSLPESGLPRHVMGVAKCRAALRGISAAGFLKAHLLFIGDVRDSEFEGAMIMICTSNTTVHERPRSV